MNDSERHTQASKKYFFRPVDIANGEFQLQLLAGI